MPSNRVVTEFRDPRLPGFTFFNMRGDVYLKCDRCCRAWYRGQWVKGAKPPLDKATIANLAKHREAHPERPA